VGGDDSAFAEYGEFFGLAEQVDDTRRGGKYMWSSDGIMQGSSGVVQFKGRPKMGYYSSPEEIYQLTQKILQMDGHMEFNLSGRLESNGGLCDGFLRQLLWSIGRAVKEKYDRTQKKQ